MCLQGQEDRTNYYLEILQDVAVYKSARGKKKIKVIVGGSINYSVKLQSKVKMTNN